MRKVVFDKETFIDLDKKLQYLGYRGIKNYYAFKHLLYAIVLWDKILVLPDSPTFSRKYPIDLKAYGCTDATNILKKIHKNPYYIYDLYEKIRQELYEEKFNFFFPHSNLKKQRTLQSVRDVLFYLSLSNELDSGLFLSEYRQSLAHSFNISPRSIVTRKDVIELIDKEVLEYYRDFCERYGTNNISIDAPLLVDYVCDYTDSFSDAIKVAKDIAKEPMVREFRKTMFCIEESAKRGDFLEVEKYLSPIKEIVPDIVNQFRTKKTSFTLQFAPSISGESFLPSVEKEFSFNIRGILDRKHRQHVTFLYDLALFGLMQRLDVTNGYQ